MGQRWAGSLNTKSYIFLEEEHVECKGARKAGDDWQLGGEDGARWVGLAVESS